MNAEIGETLLLLSPFPYFRQRLPFRDTSGDRGDSVQRCPLSGVLVEQGADPLVMDAFAGSIFRLQNASVAKPSRRYCIKITIGIHVV
jgi:hypothetical protein